MAKIVEASTRTRTRKNGRSKGTKTRKIRSDKGKKRGRYK